jgi:hypothetical protein
MLNPSWSKRHVQSRKGGHAPACEETDSRGFGDESDPAALDGGFQELVRGDAGGMGRIDLYVPSGSSDAPYFFLNVGAIGAQFEAVAAQVYEKARDKGLGQEIPTDWFLQDTRD